ncbi:MAG TPA: FAD-dependent oxidoreductase [Gemmatimonadales bacterium]|nr:FAD-dependent oxidoreductase [Gemmatimonadales bacterium]
MTSRPDAIVVGAGIVGAACAHALSRHGLRVTVVDEAFAGGGTTAAGMGHIVVMDDSDAQFALTSYSARLLDDLVASLPPAAEFQRCGTLWVAEDEAQLEAARGKQAYFEGRGVRTELLDAAALGEAEPMLRRGLAGGLRVPSDAVVYPPAVARWLLDEAKVAGAVLREGVRVDAVLPRAVVTTAGRLDAGVVINAAGAGAARLTPGLPVVPRKGHLVITERAPGFCRHQVVELGYLQSAHTMSAASVAFNVQPRVTGQLLIGSSRELVGWDASLNRALLSRMLERALRFMPGLARIPALRTWTGFRPATPDKLPLVGAWPAVDGLWIAAGHEGLGITTALGTGALLADLILGHPTGIDPAPFAPDRVLADAAVPPLPEGEGAGGEG